MIRIESVSAAVVSLVTESRTVATVWYGETAGLSETEHWHKTCEEDSSSVNFHLFNHDRFLSDFNKRTKVSCFQHPLLPVVLQMIRRSLPGYFVSFLFYFFFVKKTKKNVKAYIQMIMSVRTENVRRYLNLEYRSRDHKTPLMGLLQCVFLMTLFRKAMTGGL